MEDNEKNTEVVENNKVEQNEKEIVKQKKVRKILVVIVAIIAMLAIFVYARGEFLEIKEIGENYSSIFHQNMKNISITAIINFAIVFSVVYITTKRVKSGLKIFFEDEKKPMPKLPHKSMAFIIATIVTIATSSFILEKAQLCFYNTQFVENDPILGLDVGYFVFVWPFLELVVMYAMYAIIAATIYAAIYYILVFNICFDGITRESVKRSGLVNQALTNLKIFVVIIAVLLLLETQNIGLQKFLVLNNEETINYSLYGAGITEVKVKFIGYIIFVPVMLIAAFKAISSFKKKNTKNVITSILVIPGYLVTLLLVMVGYNLIYVNSNELDKEKVYIGYNIKNTKEAYGIDIDEIEVNDEGTITQEAINNNQDTIENVPIVTSDMLLKDLSSSNTSKGYYEFGTTSLAVYNIDGKEKLVYVSPREITSKQSAYNTKTYEYTHGFGAIISQATKVSENGNVIHSQKDFEKSDEIINISEPRIYFGLTTNNTIVTNSNGKKEFDYPTQDATQNTENSYEGEAGITANFIDRLVLAIKEKDIKLVFSGNVTNESKILINRNVVQRAKTLMTYLTYDTEPYMIIDSDGELIWVLDAYTTSNNYPYSQKTTLKDNGISKDEINYIRNSVKVTVNAYSGEIKFYITDKADPIAMVYKKIYPDLFTDEEIPEDISSHLTYPKYLYKIQAEVLERYHNVQPDVLYRNDDVWAVATHSSSRKITSSKGTTIEPYYTMTKTVDSDESKFSLVLPYTPYGKQNIKSYLVGTVSDNGENVLKLYNYAENSNVLGPMQLDTQLEQDETISKELESLNVTGTKITKGIIIVPIDNTLLYVEPIYQQYVNEKDSLPVLKKVVVASGSKVAIGNTYSEAMSNLVSQYAVNIEVENTDDLNELMDQVIRANGNLDASMKTGDWEQTGKDITKLQNLIRRLEELKKEKDQKAEANKIENNEVVQNLEENEIANETL